VSFDVVVPAVDELTEGKPEEVVLENARRKACAGMEQAGRARPVLAVDTEVVLDGRVLGKAGNVAEARAHLTALAGRTHEVLSGVVLLAPDTAISERSGVARSAVTFRDLDDRLLEAYLESGEWRDRAGAYAVQGLGSAFVEGVEGDLANVIGLPVTLLLELEADLFLAAGDSPP
jgi:septum formation protein